MINKVQYLLDNKFSTLSLTEKVKIKSLGRPTPNLKLTNKVLFKGKEITRKFNKNIYDRNQWICGCEVKIYCSVYHVCSSAMDKTYLGQIMVLGTLATSLKKLKKKHESSSYHINSLVNLSVLGKRNISAQLCDAFRRKLEEDNEQEK